MVSNVVLLLYLSRIKFLNLGWHGSIYKLVRIQYRLTSDYVGEQQMLVPSPQQPMGKLFPWE